MSDMYFVRVRPLSKEFRRAQSDAGGGGGGGGGGNQVGALSEQQRQIIAATFNVQRDRKKMTADKVRENSIVIALSQSRLREQVDGLLTRMNSRLVEQDPAFKKVAELLPLAVTEMKAAESKLQAVNPEAALPPEQKALQHLQRAEEEYEMQVQIQRQQGGGGGGGGSSAMAQDLADLFEMELDKMANQYESRQQASQEQSDQKLDELMEKLKELARRQEQEAERQRRRAALGQQASGGGSGQQQRDLADQAEEAARRLEQLSREENRPELMQSARQLREAADAMRKAAANGQQGGAQAAEALDRLKEAERRLQQTKGGRAERDVKNALQQAEELAREQQEIAEDVKGLDSAGERRQEKAQQVVQRKGALEQKVGELERQLDRSASDLRAQEKEAARKLAEGAESIRNSKVRDKIRYSSSMVRAGSPQTEQQAMEGSIGSNLESLKNTLGQAAAALGKPSQADAMSQALDRARELARGVDSLDQRMRERQQRQQGRQGQQGQEGQQGQQGQQGQSGQPGQQGQQGQGQQGQQGQGQQGQQGQGQQGQQGQGQQGQQGQGQQGQQGEGQQGGQGGTNDGSRTQGGRDGNGDTTGRFNDSGGYGDRRPGRFDGARFDPDDVRQFRGEARQFVNDAQQLRRMIQGQGVDAKALDEVLRNLRALDDDRVYQDAATLERLQSAVSEGMKRFEFNLRRQADVKSTEVFLSGSDDVPEEYRKLVEQVLQVAVEGARQARERQAGRQEERSQVRAVHECHGAFHCSSSSSSSSAAR